MKGEKGEFSQESDRVDINENTVRHPDYTSVKDLTFDQFVQYVHYMKDNPKPPPPEVKRESGLEIFEVETLILSFESEFSVQELMSIDTIKEALGSPLRAEAKKAIEPILKIIETLKKETDISQNKLEELDGKYKKFSNAIGILNSASGTVDHNRNLI